MVPSRSQPERSETDVIVFISSVMNNHLNHARQIAKEAIEEISFGRPWAFEQTPASSENPSSAYLRKVQEADFVVWLVGSETTQAVIEEINACIASGRRLLVFKLPAQTRDSHTESFLYTVRAYAKWKEVDSLEALKDHIRAAFADEVVRALRDPAVPVRAQALRKESNWSLSCCKTAFRALGVGDSLAEELSYDPDVGAVLEASDAGLSILVGPQGSGKTLAAHRLFQRTIDLYFKDSSTPFPVFLEARDVHDSLRDAIDQKCRGHADPYVQHVMVVVDAVDEKGISDARLLLRQMETLVDANPRAIVMATTRSLPGLTFNGPTREVSPLGTDEVVTLVQRIVGHETNLADPRYWRQSIRESAKYPLFAIMIGVWLRENKGIRDLSGHALVKDLVETAARETSFNSEEVDRSLQMLAATATTRGTRVAPQDVARTGAMEREVANSRLVHQTETGIDFALPIFREWYAARSILEGTVQVAGQDLRSDRWTVPISIVVHSEMRSIAREVMEYLVSKNVSMAAAVLKEDEAAWYVEEATRAAPLSAMEAGEQLRSAMGAWERGLGRLFRLVGPVDPRGGVATVGVKLDRTFLTVSWYSGKDQLSPVVELDETHSPFGTGVRTRRNVGWASCTMREIPPTELWCWVITREHLVDNLREALERREFLYGSTEATSELVWEFATVVRKDGRFEPRIAVVDVLDEVERMLAQTRTVQWGLGGWEYSRHEIEIIRDHLLMMQGRGQDAICDPWPGPDVPNESGWFGYSDQRIVDRTNASYAGALRLYERTVEHWFRAFAERLKLYRLLPVRIEGKVSSESGGWGRGSVWWRPVILPKGEESQVAFEGGSWGRDVDAIEERFREQWDAYRRLRREDAEGVSLFEHSALVDSASRRPATDLAQEWLSKELEGLGWGRR